MTTIYPIKQKLLHKRLLPCENFFEISPRSRRDLSENRGAFWSPRFPYLVAISAPRRDHGRDRGVILRRDHSEIREILAAKNVPRSRRDSCRDRSELWKSRQANTRRDVAARSRRDTEISAAKTRRDSEVILRSLAGIRGEKRNSWWSKSWQFPAAKIGSMRTKFTFTLTVNQTTRHWQNYVLYCSSRNC